MKKRFFTLTLVLVMLLGVLAGCSGKKDGETPQDGFAAPNYSDYTSGELFDAEDVFVEGKINEIVDMNLPYGYLIEVEDENGNKWYVEAGNKNLFNDYVGQSCKAYGSVYDVHSEKGYPIISVFGDDSYRVEFSDGKSFSLNEGSKYDKLK